MKPASVAKLDKHLREVTDEKAYRRIRDAVDSLDVAMSRCNSRKYEDVITELRDAKACIELAMEYIQELLP